MGNGWTRQTGSGYSLNLAGKGHDLTFDLPSVVRTYEGKRETRPRKLYDQPCGLFGYVLQMAEEPFTDTAGVTGQSENLKTFSFSVHNRLFQILCDQFTSPPMCCVLPTTLAN